MRVFIGIALITAWSVYAPAIAAQEKVIVSHTTRGSLSIGTLLYGIERGFYRDEGSFAHKRFGFSKRSPRGSL